MREKKALFLLLALVFVGVLLCLKVERRERLKLLYRSPSDYNGILPVRCDSVVPVIYRRIPCLAPVPVAKRKRLFIWMVLPAVLVENHRISRLRERLMEIKDRMEDGSLSEEDEAFLRRLCLKYRARTIDELLYKVAPVPPGLAIAQAAIETGWGTSRFFCQANNLFGEWSFSGKGIKAKESSARLKVFPDILASVRSYFYNLNAGWAYEGFRMARARNPSSLALVKHLEKYSILGKEYVRRLERVIKGNRLDEYDSCKIDSDYILSDYHLRLSCPF